MGKTSIEWTDHSVNPFRAMLGNGSGHYCEKVSPGCKNCYSSALQPRFRMPRFQEQRRADVKHRLDVSKLEDVLRRRKPTTYFWCDMTDMFGAWVPDEWIAACFGVMAATPHHTHQVLTKRSRRMREWFAWADAETRRGLITKHGTPLALCASLAADHVGEGILIGLLERTSWPLPNVWLGVSAEDQQRADERIPDLLATPAAVRFVSAEPLLGPIDFSRVAPPGFPHDVFDAVRGTYRGGLECPRIDWLIAGGESGQRARPCDVAWIRSIVEQCRAGGVACFVKQLGAYPHHGSDGAGVAYSSLHGRHWRWDENARRRDLEVVDRLDGGELIDGPGRLYVYAQYDKKGGDPEAWPRDLRVRQMPEARDERKS